MKDAVLAIVLICILKGFFAFFNFFGTSNALEILIVIFVFICYSVYKHKLTDLEQKEENKILFYSKFNISKKEAKSHIVWMLISLLFGLGIATKFHSDRIKDLFAEEKQKTKITEIKQEELKIDPKPREEIEKTLFSLLKNNKFPKEYEKRIDYAFYSKKYEDALKAQKEQAIKILNIEYRSFDELFFDRTKEFVFYYVDLDEDKKTFKCIEKSTQTLLFSNGSIRRDSKLGIWYIIYIDLNNVSLISERIFGDKHQCENEVESYQAMLDAAE